MERAPYLQVRSYTALVVRERVSPVKEGIRVSRGSHSNSELKRIFAVMVVRVLLVGSVFNPTSTAAISLRSTHLTALINYHTFDYLSASVHVNNYQLRSGEMIKQSWSIF